MNTHANEQPSTQGVVTLTQPWSLEELRRIKRSYRTYMALPKSDIRTSRLRELHKEFVEMLNNTIQDRISEANIQNAIMFNEIFQGKKALIDRICNQLYTTCVRKNEKIAEVILEEFHLERLDVGQVHISRYCKQLAYYFENFMRIDSKIHDKGMRVVFYLEGIE